MRVSLFLAALTPLALAAPTYDEWRPAKTIDGRAVNAYFRSLSKCVGQSKVVGDAPMCDLSNAVMPESKFRS